MKAIDWAKKLYYSEEWIDARAREHLEMLEHTICVAVAEEQEACATMLDRACEHYKSKSHECARVLSLAAGGYADIIRARTVASAEEEM